MMLASLIFGAPGWLLPATVIGAIALGVVAWVYRRAPASWRVRTAAGLLKAAGILILLVALIEPLFNGSRPRPGANLFVILADASQSLQVRDRPGQPTRAAQLHAALQKDSAWQTRLAQDFQLRRYEFAARLHSVTDFEHLASDGPASALGASLTALTRRYEQRPLAGVLLLTDGNATDLADAANLAGELLPIYPVVLGEAGGLRDVRVERVSVSQTNFEAAPVTLRAQITARGCGEENLRIELLDEQGKLVEVQTAASPADVQPHVARFQLRPKKSGVHFYRVRVLIESEAVGEIDIWSAPEQSREATLWNNTRYAVVDRAGGPYRVLYVSGRANWEFKFLRRAIEDDAETELVGLVRIAKREPKFDFRSRRGESTNPLFRGFDADDEQAERYDQPVTIRLGTHSEEELRDGFPKTADELFAYHAIVLDDLEADYFTEDQKTLVARFVSERGGGLLMLGGRSSFAAGGYDRTPIGELLPVYLDVRQTASPPGSGYRLRLTREGWLQPWVRLRKTEDEEHLRFDAMPAFGTLSRARGIKPGASVLAEVSDSSGNISPALVAQRFGRGRSAALLLGDLWRWGMRREQNDPRDLEKAWRQTIRWLVAEVPRQVEVESRRDPQDNSAANKLRVRVRDREFKPLDNAAVEIRVDLPEGGKLTLAAESGDAEPGLYEVDYTPRQRGAYRAGVVVNGPDGSEIGRRELGWTAEPAIEEFQRLEPNRELLEQLAEQSGGEVIDAAELDDFVKQLPNRKIPITEPWIYPVWHHPFFFLLAIACFAGEWGLRRYKGLA